MRKLVNIKSIRESYKLLEDVNELGYDVIKKNASHWTVSKVGIDYDVKKHLGFRVRNWVAIDNLISLGRYLNNWRLLSRSIEINFE